MPEKPFNKGPRKIVKVFYLDGNKVKYVTTDVEHETIKYLQSEGYKVIGRK